jgi:hypothetical protein
MIHHALLPNSHIHSSGERIRASQKNMAEALRGQIEFYLPHSSLEALRDEY